VYNRLRMEQVPESNPLSQASVLLQDRAMPPEERASILKQIEKVVEEGRQPITGAAFLVKPSKRGVLLVVLINSLAAVLVAVGILVLAYTFRFRQGTVALRGGELVSAEGRLLEVFRRQAESRLQEQESEVARAQLELRSLEGTLERRLAAREAALRRALDAELSSERARLKERGAAVADVEARLRALERERQAALTAELARYRRGLELDRLADEQGRQRELSALQGLIAAPAELATPIAAVPDPALTARLAAVERDLAAARRELEVSRRQSTERQTRLNEAQRQLTDRDRQIQELKQKSDRLTAQLASVNSRAETLGQQAQAAGEQTARQARDAAFKDIIAFLDSLKEKEGGRSSQLTAQARQDPLFGTVMREIQILAAGLGLAGAQSVLLGTVSSISGSKVVVEPLATVVVKAGTRVQIRRGTEPGNESIIARGIVQQAGAGRITVLLDAADKSALSPAVMDSVYVVGASSP